MWEINNLSQLMGFLYSSILGIIYCVVYDFLRAIRNKIDFGTIAVFFQDIIFSIFCAVNCFIFFIAVTAGEIRGFVIVGIILGFVIARLTVSHITFFIFLKMITVILFLRNRLNGLFELIFKYTDHLFAVISKKVKEICKFFSNTLKKGLKKG